MRHHSTDVHVWQRLQNVKQGNQHNDTAYHVAETVLSHLVLQFFKMRQSLVSQLLKGAAS